MGFLKAVGVGSLALASQLYVFGAAGWLLWAVGTGLIDGWLNVLAVSAGLLLLLLGIFVTAVLGVYIREGTERDGKR